MSPPCLIAEPFDTQCGDDPAEYAAPGGAGFVIESGLLQLAQPLVNRLQGKKDQLVPTLRWRVFPRLFIYYEKPISHGRPLM